jgi:hypothetical protein
MSIIRLPAATTLMLLLIPVVRGNSASCVQDTLNNYVAPDFSCAIGDQLFSNFSAFVVGLSGTPTAVSGITVTPGGDSLDPSFSFSGNFAVSGLLGTEDFVVSYTATAPSADLFTEMSLSLSGATTTGAATINAEDAVCLGGSFSPVVSPLVAPLTCNGGVGLNLNLNSEINNTNLSQPFNLGFSAVSTLGVVKELSLVGALGGSAQVSAIENDLSADTPEPSTISQLVIAISFLVLVRLARPQSWVDRR